MLSVPGAHQSWLHPLHPRLTGSIRWDRAYRRCTPSACGGAGPLSMQQTQSWGKPRKPGETHTHKVVVGVEIKRLLFRCGANSHYYSYINMYSEPVGRWVKRFQFSYPTTRCGRKPCGKIFLTPDKCSGSLSVSRISCSSSNPVLGKLAGCWISLRNVLFVLFTLRRALLVGKCWSCYDYFHSTVQSDLLMTQQTKHDSNFGSSGEQDVSDYIKTNIRNIIWSFLNVSNWISRSNTLSSRRSLWRQQNHQPTESDLKWCF